MKLIFMGPPGSGKGTYAIRVGPKLGIPHISTGHIFRNEIKSGSELGKELDSYISKGNLVPDELTVSILKKRLEERDCENGFILDGYPRTLEQAKMLDKITKIDLVVNFHLAEHILIKKLSARRVCRKCGDIYNIADIHEGEIHLPPMPSKEEGKCDKCGGTLIQRVDDNPEMIRTRLEIYRDQSRPVVDYYRGRIQFIDLNMTGAVDLMVNLIMDKLSTVMKGQESR